MTMQNFFLVFIFDIPKTNPMYGDRLHISLQVNGVKLEYIGTFLKHFYPTWIIVGSSDGGAKLSCQTRGVQLDQHLMCWPTVEDLDRQIDRSLYKEKVTTPNPAIPCHTLLWLNTVCPAKPDITVCSYTDSRWILFNSNCYWMGADE